MRILVTNDDGIDSPGILALTHAMQKLGEVVVVAPDRQQSAVGHALTVSSPLRATPFHRDGSMFGWAINGTPADCVKLAISTLLDIKPDIVVSGINHGSNASVNAIYSGTVSAATEGTLMGVPSIAVSNTSFSHETDMQLSAKVAYTVASQLLQMQLPKGTLLNVNVPAIPEKEFKGLKICRQGRSVWNDNYERRTDPHGREYFWLTGEFVMEETVEDADDVALLEGYASITPLHYELTNFEVYKKLKLQGIAGAE